MVADLEKAPTFPLAAILRLPRLLVLQEPGHLGPPAFSVPLPFESDIEPALMFIERAHQ